MSCSPKFRTPRLVAAIVPLVAMLLTCPVGAQGGQAPTDPPVPDATKPAPPTAPKPPAAPRMPAAGGAAAPKVTAVDDAPTPKAIWAKFVEATGGEAAIQREGSRSSKGRMLIPAAGIEGTMETLVRSPNLLLVRTNIPNIGEMLQGYDGAHGWSVDPMGGPRLIEGDELEPLLRSADIAGPAMYLERAKSSKTLGHADFRGRDTWVVELEGLFSSPTTFYFDRADGLMRGMRTTAKGPMGNIPVEVEMAEYKQFGAAKFPSKSISRMMMQEITFTVDETNDAEIPLSVFEAPAEIKALIAAKKAAPAPAPGDAKKKEDGSKPNGGSKGGDTPASTR